jgi:hypothetical protein
MSTDAPVQTQAGFEVQPPAPSETMLSVVVSQIRSPLFRSHRLNLEVDRDLIADHRNAFERFAELQTELAPAQWLRRRLPTSRFLPFLCQELHMQRDRFGYAMHGEVADNVARIRTGPLNASAPKADLRELRDVKKICAAQVRIAFRDSCVNALHLNRGGHRRFLWMLAIKFDGPAKLFEAARYCGDGLVHFETDSRVCGVDLKNFSRISGWERHRKKDRDA